jgi:hypothetical protein
VAYCCAQNGFSHLHYQYGFLYLYFPSGPSWPVLGRTLPFTITSTAHHFHRLLVHALGNQKIQKQRHTDNKHLPHTNYQITSLPLGNDSWDKVKYKLNWARHIITTVTKCHEPDQTFTHDGSIVKRLVFLAFLLSNHAYSNTTTNSPWVFKQ